jgi:hypothetical protein
MFQAQAAGGSRGHAHRPASGAASDLTLVSARALARGESSAGLASDGRSGPGQGVTGSGLAAVLVPPRAVDVITGSASERHMAPVKLPGQIAAAENAPRPR